MKKILTLVGLWAIAVLVGQAGDPAERPIQAGISATSWTAVGPEGGDIKSIAVHPLSPSEATALVAGQGTSIYRTTNGGQSWQRVALVNDDLHDIDYDPLNGAVLYAPGSSRLWKSADGGGSWSSYPLPGSTSLVGHLAVHPSSPNILYGCGSSGSGSSSFVAFFKSVDSGATWTTREVSLSGSSAEADGLAISPAGPNTIYLSGSYSTGSSWVNRLYKSLDGGSSWNDVTPSVASGARIYALAVDPTNAEKVYAGTAWAVLRSADGGATWSKNGGRAFSYELAVDRNNPNIIYSGYFREVYKSTDGGVNWTKSVGMYGDCATIQVSQPLVYFGSEAGVYRSLDAAFSWQEASSGINASSIVTVTASAASPNIVYAEIKGLALYWSLNFGASWSRCSDFSRCDSIIRILTPPAKANEVLALVAGQGG